MHELSVARALLDRAGEVAAEHDAERVDAVTVELGAATHVNPDQLRLCLETVAEATVAADATVDIETVAPRAACDCGWEGEPPEFEGTAAVVPTARCPACGARTEFVRGKECHLTAVTVPDDADATATAEDSP
ncbi:hydrogenase maturation nickel metallochaperone HypA/HybF [Haloarcula sediminis]|uniref:hydrogenase maturation nickel metallochaperone HypA/HybF n=1 Tax=Haloarcula sediminis TaxID=3111777 RepID=UPI002D7975CA|nr:hydrogenase maturation nickel metallochaperone HypA [Haloarcula sp. CK38]